MIPGSLVLTASCSVQMKSWTPRTVKQVFNCFFTDLKNTSEERGLSNMELTSPMFKGVLADRHLHTFTRVKVDEAHAHAMELQANAVKASSVLGDGAKKGKRKLSDLIAQGM
jgi:hypothetical protein